MQHRLLYPAASSPWIQVAFCSTFLKVSLISADIRATQQKQWNAVTTLPVQPARRLAGCLCLAEIWKQACGTQRCSQICPLKYQHARMLRECAVNFQGPVPCGMGAHQNESPVGTVVSSSPLPPLFHRLPSPLGEEETQVPPAPEKSEAARSCAAGRQEKDCDSSGELAAECHTNGLWKNVPETALRKS